LAETDRHRESDDATCGAEEEQQRQISIPKPGSSLEMFKSTRDPTRETAHAIAASQNIGWQGGCAYIPIKKNAGPPHCGCADQEHHADHTDLFTPKFLTALLVLSRSP
jgi:hypothetical protein